MPRRMPITATTTTISSNVKPFCLVLIGAAPPRPGGLFFLDHLGQLLFAHLFVNVDIGDGGPRLADGARVGHHGARLDLEQAGHAVPDGAVGQAIEPVVDVHQVLLDLDFEDHASAFEGQLFRASSIGSTFISVLSFDGSPVLAATVRTGVHGQAFARGADSGLPCSLVLSVKPPRPFCSVPDTATFCLL